jgi:hypothetical protein
MAMTFSELNGGKVLELEVTGKLTDEDYRRWVPEFERLAESHGKIRLLFEMNGFHGWEARAAWDDLKFGVRHFNDIERLAMVGDKRWQHWMAGLCKVLTTGKVRYFDRSEAGRARAWIEGTEGTQAAAS